MSCEDYLISEKSIRERSSAVGTTKSSCLHNHQGAAAKRQSGASQEADDSFGQSQKSSW